MVCVNRCYSWRDNHNQNNLAVCLALNDHTTISTAVTDFFVVNAGKLLKISTMYFVDLRTFWATPASKLVFRNNQMAMPASESIVFSRYKRENLMCAGGHNDSIL